MADRRAQTYRLTYADDQTESVVGVDPTAALATRSRAERPHTIANVTAIGEWLAAIRRSREGATDDMRV